MGRPTRHGGYEWLTSNNGLTVSLYAMHQLLHHFYGLSNQALAYHEGLALVAYLHERGTNRRQHCLDALRASEGFSTALSQVYHFCSQAALFNAWHAKIRHPLSRITLLR